MEKKLALALKREQEDRERKNQLELEEAFKKKSTAGIPDHVICAHIKF